MKTEVDEKLKKSNAVELVKACTNMVIQSDGDVWLAHQDKEIVLTNGTKNLILSDGKVRHTYGDTILTNIKEIEEALKSIHVKLTERLINNYKVLKDRMGIVPLDTNLYELDIEYIRNIMAVRDTYTPELLFLTHSSDLFTYEVVDKENQILSMIFDGDKILMFLKTIGEEDFKNTQLFIKGVMDVEAIEEDGMTFEEDMVISHINIAQLRPLPFKMLYNLVSSRDLLYYNGGTCNTDMKKIRYMLEDDYLNYVHSSPVIEEYEDLYFKGIGEDIYVYVLKGDVYERIFILSNKSAEYVQPIYNTLSSDEILKPLYVGDMDNVIAEHINESFPRHKYENRCININRHLSPTTINMYLHNIMHMKDEEEYERAISNMDKQALKHIDQTTYNILKETYVNKFR